jgi:hypothetical protein
VTTTEDQTVDASTSGHAIIDRDLYLPRAWTGVPAAWVTGDEVYGADPGLRAELEARGIGYVLAVACDHPVPLGAATHRADALLGRVPARAWQQVSCGKGARATATTTGRSLPPPCS